MNNWMRRYDLIHILGVTVFGIMIGRVGYLQFQGPTLVHKSIQFYASRKNIIDQNGIPVALDVPSLSLYLHPEQIEEPLDQLVIKLAPILDISPIILSHKLRTTDGVIRLVDQMSSERVLQIRALGLQGIEFVDSPKRIYPQRGVAANLIGYLDLDKKGQAGIENLCDSWLNLESFILQGPHDLYGNIQRSIIQESLGLTLDINLQTRVAQAVELANRKYCATRSCAIVMNACTGQICALVTAPSYDPNNYHRFPIQYFRSWPSVDIFEPGSTFKPINLAIAIEANTLTTVDQILDPGKIQIQDTQILNVGVSPTQKKHYELVTPETILTRSSNVGMVKIMEKLSPELYYDWLSKLGLGKGSCLGMGLPDVAVESVLKSKSEFCINPLEPAVASFGQGLALTPMKLLQLIAALGNGGLLCKPHVVLGTFEPNFHFIKKKPLKVPSSHSIFTSSSSLVRMLETVIIDKEATGNQAFLPGYRVAGKTGTAQKASSSGGYRTNAVNTSFVALYPAEHTRYAILILVDEPTIPYNFASNTVTQIAQVVLKIIFEETNAIPTMPFNSVSERTMP